MIKNPQPREWGSLSRGGYTVPRGGSVRGEKIYHGVDTPFIEGCVWGVEHLTCNTVKKEGIFLTCLVDSNCRFE